MSDTELEGTLDIGGGIDGTLDFGGGLDGNLDIGGVTVVCNDDYEALKNKPSIEGHVLVGDSLLHEIGVGDITPQDIDRIIFG